VPLGFPPLTCRWPKPSDHREGQKLFVKVAGLSRRHDFRCRGRPATARLAAWSPLLPCFHGRPLVVVHLGMPAVSRSRSVPVAREILFFTGGGSFLFTGLSRLSRPHCSHYCLPRNRTPVIALLCRAHAGRGTFGPLPVSSGCQRALNQRQVSGGYRPAATPIAVPGLCRW
jgi:hypothetical protein